jgi:Flp pilus assembly protein TadD
MDFASVPAIMSRRRLRSLSDPHCTERQNEQPREITLARRARKHALRGERREAMLALKQACFSAPGDARLWALYAASCWRLRRYDDAARAFRQAIFLRARSDEAQRVAVLKDLLSAVEAGGAPRAVIAA